MGHEPCKIESAEWLKICGDHDECIAVCVDDMLIASKYPQGEVDALINKQRFRLKVADSMSYHLG